MTTTEDPLAASASGGDAVTPGRDEPRRDRPRPDGRPASPGGHRVGGVLTAGGVYLVLAVLLWWNVWSTHPTSTTTCGCGDSSLFTWFLAWPPYALSHGLNPLYSTALFHPAGVNLLSNTAEVGPGLVLAPVTWLFGPVATLNVSLTLSPFLSALAMFVLVRRWVRWQPAAFAAGLLYGFSPFVLIGLTDAHLMLSMAPIPPLVVLCLDELLVRQRRSPVASGTVLGLLVTVQFFIGTEVLVIIAIAAAFGVGLMVLYGLRHRDVLLERARHALVALGAAAVTAGVLLAYPVWFALAGPAHLSGPVWGPLALISYGGADLRDYVLPAAPSAAYTQMAHRLGGYQAPTLSGQYFGIGLILVLAVGVLIWRRDRRLWLFGAVGAFSVSLSLGLQFHSWTPWRLFVRLPLMENVIPSRFLLVTYLCAAVMLGIIVDRTFAGVSAWNAAPPEARRPPAPGVGLRGAGTVAGAVVAAAALVPIAAYYSSGVPFTATPVVVPTWFRTVAPHLRGHQVLLAFPVPFALQQSSLTWQAVDGMPYAMAGGSGPNALASRAGSEQAGQVFLGNASISGGPQKIVPGEVGAVRHALDGWGVTMVVLPDPAGLPVYERVRQVRGIAVLVTAATGRQPVRQGDAWVWADLDRAGPPVAAAAARLSRCAAGPPTGTPTSIQRSTGCVVAAATADSTAR